MSFSKRSKNLIEIFVIALSLIICQTEASILNGPLNLPIGYYVESNDDPLQQNPYYANQLMNDYGTILNGIPIQQRDVSPSAALAASEGLEYLVDQTSSSPILSSNQVRKLETLDARKLINFLNQLKQEDFTTDSINDINIHFPASNTYEDNVISDPVNDPVEFEATLSYITNTLNHEIPNSSNRSAMLDTLMPIYIGTIMKQMQQQQHQPQKDDEPKKQQQDNFGHNYLVGRVLTSSDNIDSESDQDNSSSYSMNENDEQQNDASISNDSSSPTPASRYGGSEYIDHPLALVGHQYMQGGAGEGKQLLGPDGTFENVQVIKTDHAVPSYCDPPNPCPLGFTSEDGCLENFVNSASFSREYQAKQQCSCDNEHSLFNCASPVSTMKNQIYSSSDKNHQDTDEDKFNEFTPPTSSSSSYSSDLNINDRQQNKLDTLARTIQNRFGGLESVRNIIEKHKEEMANNNNQDVHLSRVAKKAPRNEANFRY